MMRTSSAPDRSVLVVSFGVKVFGIDRWTGAPRWEVDLGVHGEADLHIVADVVIAVTSSDILFLDYRSGGVHAKVNLGVEYERRPTSIVDEGHVYVGTNGELVCFTLQGHRVWHQPFTGKGVGSMALALPGNVRQADDVGSK